MLTRRPISVGQIPLFKQVSSADDVRAFTLYANSGRFSHTANQILRLYLALRTGETISGLWPTPSAYERVFQKQADDLLRLSMAIASRQAASSGHLRRP